MWIDPPEYYDPPGPGVLAFDPELPSSLVRPEGGMDTRAHSALLAHPTAVCSVTRQTRSCPAPSGCICWGMEEVS